MCHACCGRKYPECCFSSFTIFFNRFIIRPTFIFDRDKMDSADQFDRTKMTTDREKMSSADQYDREPKLPYN